MNFKKWLQTLLDEKGLAHECITIEHEDFTHFIEMDFLVEFLAGLDRDLQEKVRMTLVKIDFMNGDVMHFLNHCATGYIRINYQ